MKRRDAIRATAGAVALAALLCASGGLTGPASAQAANNPADIREPAAREPFTFTFRSSSAAEAGSWTLNETPSLELSAGDKWRFTFDLDNSELENRLNLDSLRAGAFFDVTPRMSLGGAFTFSGEDPALTRATQGALHGDVPEVKFESAFKF